MGESTRMEWKRLLCAERLGDKTYQPQRNRSIFVQDHDRIVFSAPFRRLANKTQVQPLYENDHVHHRLIHSVEVGSVGRSLAMRVGDWLISAGHLPEAQLYDLADITQAACVAHDIGNPPFGHSGEAAMGDWFAALFAAGGSGLARDLAPELRGQFTRFEGNAQGFRILTRLEMYRGQGGMRLTKAMLGAFTKYPLTDLAHQTLAALQPVPPGFSLKKYGVFAADQPQFDAVAEACGLIAHSAAGAQWYARHPLVYLMEAADDITYNIVDLEDAFATGELSFDLVRKLLADLAGQSNSPAGLSETEEIAYLRARSIGSAISAAIAAFIAGYDQIMTGQFEGDLIGASDLAAGFATIRKVARERIFTAPRKTELEIAGRRILSNVLTGVLPVFEELREKAWAPEALSGHNAQLVRALSLDLRDVTDAQSALHALADFTSGMTDRYALRIARMLSGTASV